MSSDDNTRNEPDTNFSFAVRELRSARKVQELTVDAAPIKALGEHRGSDPYNTSGSFDRKKNWLRIGKR